MHHGLIDLCDAGALLRRDELISAIRSDTRFTCVTMSSIVLPASSTIRAPDSTRSTLAPISVLISFAAFALRCASARTSPATTANPRP